LCTAQSNPAGSVITGRMKPRLAFTVAIVSRMPGSAVAGVELVVAVMGNSLVGGEWLATAP